MKIEGHLAETRLSLTTSKNSFCKTPSYWSPPSTQVFGSPNRSPLYSSQTWFPFRFSTSLRPRTLQSPSFLLHPFLPPASHVSPVVRGLNLLPSYPFYRKNLFPSLPRESHPRRDLQSSLVQPFLRSSTYLPTLTLNLSFKVKSVCPFMF